MTINYVPFKRSNPYFAAELRAAEIIESIRVLPEEDQQFMYERINN